MKRFFTLLVALVAMMSVYAKGTKIGTLYYELWDSDNTATVCYETTTTSNYAYVNSVAVPDKVTHNGKTYVVRAIGANAFKNAPDLKSITIGDSVKVIGESAFENCARMTGITVGLSVQTIGDFVFKGCTSLKSVYWNARHCQDFVYTEGEVINTLFYYYDWKKEVAVVDLRENITTFQFGDEVEYIPALLCYQLWRVSSVTLPNSLREIGDMAFADCKGFSSIEIPNGVWRIGRYAFEFCQSLTSLTIPNSVTTIETYAFYLCYRISSVRIGFGLTKMGTGVFKGCSGLQKVTWLAKNCQDFSDYNTPFYYKNNFDIRDQIREIQFANTEHIPAHLCDGLHNITKVSIPNTNQTIGEGAFKDCAQLNDVTIGAGTHTIGKSAFADCTELTNVCIMDGVKTIGDSAFIGCQKVTHVDIGKSVETIGTDVFKHWSALTSVKWYAINCSDFGSDNSPFYRKGSYSLRSQITSFTFGNEVKHIPANLCRVMRNLTGIVIPGNVKSIGEAAFEDCKGLTSLTIEGGVVDIGAYAFAYCEGLTELTLPGSIWYIGRNAFDGCSGVPSLTLPVSVQSIGTQAFAGLTKLSSVIIPRLVSHYEGNVFLDCTGLSNIVVEPDNETYCSVEGVVFSKDKKQLIEYPRGRTGHYLIPEGVEEICQSVFFRSSLNAVIIPSTIKIIRNYAFDTCNKLYSVTCKATELPEMGTKVFAYNDCSKITLYVPFSSLEAYQNADQWKEFNPIEAIDPHFLITFVNWDDTELQKSYVEKGTIPEYTGATPERPADEKYSYTFKGWTPEVTAVTADATYTATYKKTAPLAFNPTEVKATIDLDRDYPALFNPDALPVRYTSSNPDVATVDAETGAVTLLAEGTTTITAAFAGNDDYMPCQASYQLTVEQRVWTVVYLDWNEALLDIEEVKNGDDAKGITVSREGYTFTGWSQSIENVTEDLIVKAQYEINTYTVRFFDNDGKQIGADQVINWNEAAVEPNDEDIPTVEGHTFTGWDKDFDHVKSDLDIKALYEINTYIVYFYDMVGNQLGETQIIEYGKAAVAPEAPAVEGYHFTGWDKDFDAVKSDLIVNATYEKNVYTVTFVDKDGNVLKEEKVKWDEAATAPSAPSWEGHTFTGWDTDFNHVKSDLTVKPIYDTKLYTVRFIDWNGKELKAEKVEYGAGATAPKDPEREGYTFAGWDKAFDLITEDLTVKATYTVNVYTVTFVDKESKTIGEAQKVEYGKAAEAPEAPAVEGYHFTGWDKDFSVVKGDMTIQATYEINLYTVTFIGFAGATINFQHVQHGDAAIEPEQPLVHGYHFTGWDKDFSYITSDLVVYAIYEEDDYTPQNLSVTLLPKGDDLQIIFSWDKVDGAASYEVMLAEGGKELGTRNTVGQNIVPLFLSAIVKEYHITPGTYTLDWSVRSTDDLGAPISEWAAGKAFEVTIKDTGTGMESIQHSAVSIQKVLRDGALFIIVGDRMYDAAGRLVK